MTFSDTLPLILLVMMPAAIVTFVTGMPRGRVAIWSAIALLLALVAVLVRVWPKETDTDYTDRLAPTLVMALIVLTGTACAWRAARRFIFPTLSRQKYATGAAAIVVASYAVMIAPTVL